MFKFNKTSTVQSRVNEVLKSHSETRGTGWILGLGYAECNDYAEQVRTIVSQSTGFEHVRFETVARYIRVYKARAIAAKTSTVGI